MTTEIIGNRNAAVTAEPRCVDRHYIGRGVLMAMKLANFVKFVGLDGGDSVGCYFVSIVVGSGIRISDFRMGKFCASARNSVIPRQRFKEMVSYISGTCICWI